VKTRPELLSDFVLRPVPVLAMAWFLVVALRFLWLFLTMAFPPEGDLLLLGSLEYRLATGLQVVFLVGLIQDLRIALASPPPNRRGYLAGVVLALVVLAFVQWGLQILSSPIPHP